jgi:hypothetical protein
VKNAVHCTDLAEDATLEVMIYFENFVFEIYLKFVLFSG